METPDKKIVDKPMVYLDLDNTLLHSIPSEEFHNKYKSKLDKDLLATKLNKTKVYDMKDNGKSYYLVFERPHVQEFLDFLFENFSVNIWTAATKDYAAFIIEHLVLNQRANRKLDYVFVNYHTRKSKKRYGKRFPKNLKMLQDVYEIPNMTDSNSFIIDDHPDVKSSQVERCIVAPEWNIFDEDTLELNLTALDDTFLNDVQSKLKEYLKHFKENNGQVVNVNDPGP